MTVAKKMETNSKTALEKLANMVSAYAGIHLGEKQMPMVQGRLRKRMVELQLESYEDYLRYVQKHFSEETKMLVSLLTTHHTAFFREFFHFEFLERQGLAQIVARVRERGDKMIRVWSAACSRGQEVYSLAMFLDDYLKQNAPDLSYEILGSDVDSESVRVAENGVYHRNEIKEVPLHFLADHWTRGKGDIADYVKVRSSLRSRIQFRTLNLFDINTASGLGQFDIIFCRNVFIYFNQAQIYDVSRDLLTHLQEYGFLILGISENLHGFNAVLHSLGSSIYSPQRPARTGRSESKVQDLAANTIPQAATGISLAKRIRVLVVDDSTSIHTIMKRVLSEEHGFEIVGFAKHGKEAHEMVQALRPDALTLDIHMPEMNGVEYLKTHFQKGHPPVVMVSSVSREDSGLALKALNLGAGDYVEKPAINNMLERGEEIRNKIKSVVALSKIQATGGRVLNVDREFGKADQLRSPNSFLRVVVAAMGDQERLRRLFADLEEYPGPLVLLVEGAGNVLEEWTRGMTSHSKFDLVFTSDLQGTTEERVIRVAHFSSGIEEVFKMRQPNQVGVMVMGMMSKRVATQLAERPGTYVLIEDLGAKKEAIVTSAVSDVVPATSFAYMVNHYFSRQEKG